MTTKLFLVPLFLYEEMIEVYDDLINVEDKISIEDKMSLVHIAGYVTQKDIMSEDELFETTSFYASKYGQYIDMLDRGNLKVPSDRASQWTFFPMLCSHVMLVIVKDKVCQKSLSDILLEILTCSRCL